MDRLTATNRLNDGGRLLVENPQAADLDIPLTNSIIPQRGVGAVSYTRATIATVTDHEGVIRNCLSGEARFQGARRVENGMPYSQDVTNVAWTKVNLTVTGNTTTAPDGTLTADTLTSTVTPLVFTECIQLSTITTVVGGYYTYSGYFKYNGQQFIQVLGNAAAFGVPYVNFDIQNGTITAISGAITQSITSATNGFYRISATFIATGVLANARMSMCFINNGTSVRGSVYNGDGIKAVYIWGQQFENTTGQSIQTPSEYVSTKVLSTAPFHGANVDGVKYFDTDANGVAIPKTTLKGLLVEGTRTNICSYSDFAVAGWGLVACARINNAGIAPDGTNSFVKIIPTVGSNSSYAYNTNITTTAQVYTLSCYVKADGLNFVQLRLGAGISSGLANFDLLNGVVGTRSIWTSSGIEPVIGFPGVYRIWAVTDTVLAATAAIAIQIVPAADSIAGAAVTGDGVSGILAWGMQIELGDFVSTYIPTTTVTVTRNIDVLSYSSSNAIASQGAAYCEASIILPGQTTSSIPRRIISRGGNGRILYTAVNIDSINSYDGTNGLQSNTGTTMNGNVIKMASSWSGSTKDIYYGTTAPKSGAFNGTMGTGNIDIGVDWNGTIRNLRIWKTPPTVAELTSITTL